MRDEEYERMYALEDWYWWYVARRRAALRLLRRHRPPGRRCLVLDAGCGTGAMLDDLDRTENVTALGVDISHDALQRCRQRGHERLVRADLAALPLRDESFDAIDALDVIEHVEDDERAAAELYRVLRPGGVLIATVPAYPWLWSAHDVALHHFRRYDRGTFLSLLLRAGFAVEYHSFLVTLLFPFAAASRLANRRVTNASVPGVSKTANRLLLGLHDAEAALAARAPLPFGLTLVAVARKPSAVRRHSAETEALAAPAIAGTA